MPASLACTVTQTNDSLPLLACSVGAGITSYLTRLLDIWPSVCCLPSSRPLACWLGLPDRPAAHQQLTIPIFTNLHRSPILHRFRQTEYTHLLSPYLLRSSGRPPLGTSPA